MSIIKIGDVLAFLVVSSFLKIIQNCLDFLKLMELVEEESKFIENGVINSLRKGKHGNFLNGRQKWQKALFLEVFFTLFFVNKKFILD
jgi:hypothetical protein